MAVFRKPPDKPGKPPAGTDDPWASVTRENQAAARGEHPPNTEIGDTTRLVWANPDASAEFGQPSNEILKLVTDLLAMTPDRVDLWIMRFEVLKALGMKEQFAEALIAAWNQPTVGKQINWPLVRGMWEEVAPGEPVPGGLKLPGTTGLFPIAKKGGGAKPSTKRRFADVAVQLAGAELTAMTNAYAALRAKPGFFEDYARKVSPMLARPTPLSPAPFLSRKLGTHARLLLKREDRRRVPAEEENAAAQAYVAALLGKRALITGNDVDAHSLALATMAPKFGMTCTVVLRPGDSARNPVLVKLLAERGAQTTQWSGATELKDDPREGAVRLWLQSKDEAHLALSLGTGPNPYPSMISDYQSLLGRETELQSRAASAGRPRTMVAAVTSEADSIGFFLPQLARRDVELIYAEPEPGGIAAWKSADRLLPYNGAVREHAWLRASGRIEHTAISDSQAITFQQQLGALEKVQVGLEDARAVALTALLIQRNTSPRDYVVLVA